MVFKEAMCGVIGNRLSAVPGLDHVQGLALSELQLQHYRNISSSPVHTGLEKQFKPLGKMLNKSAQTLCLTEEFLCHK